MNRKDGTKKKHHLLQSKLCMPGGLLGAPCGLKIFVASDP